jgi:tetratricopeptide (TPR) repeat protein
MSLIDEVGALLSVGDLPGATALVESADGANRELGRAQLALAKQDPKAGAAHAKKAIELGGGAHAHHLLAAAKLFAGDAQGAVDEARRGVGLDGSARSRSNLGSILLAAGRTEDAMAVLKQVVVEAPDDADAHTNLANAAVKLNDHAQAIQSYARAFECRPGDQRPIQQLVAMFVDLGRWMGAMAALEMSRQGDPPGDVAVALDLASVHIVRQVAGGKYPPAGMTADADQPVKGLLATAPQRPVGSRLIAARTLLDVDRQAEAKQLLGTIDRSKASAEDRATLTYLDGLFAQDGGDKARAIELYEEALSLDPKRIEAAINGSSLLLEEGSAASIERAAKLIVIVPPTHRGNSHLLYNEASLHARTGAFGDARARLQQIIETNAPDSPHTARAREALDQLKGR